MRHAPSGESRVLIIAHRGSSGVAPENTMAAFRRAVAMRVDMIELDVRLSRDGVPVIFHDRTLRRTAGRRGRVRDRTLEELRGLDAGGWFARRFSGERIPTLAEVLAWLPSGILINAELKGDGDRRRREVFAARCLETIRKTGATGSVLVSSFDHTLLALLRRKAPSLDLAVLIHPVRDRGRRPSVLARRVGARAVVCSARTLRRRTAEDIRRHHLTLYCYGVNTRPRLRRVIRRGVHGVITDYPDRMRLALMRHGSP